MEISPAIKMGHSCSWIIVGVYSLGLVIGYQSLAWAGTVANRDSAIAPHLHSAPFPQQPDTRYITQTPSNRVLRLRRGPYLPNLDQFNPPFPDPIFPEVIYPTRLVIRLSHRRVYVYQGNELQTSYPIAVGRPGWETPVGEYSVINMQENPAWKNPFTGEVIPAGTNNPLGDRWIGFWTDGHNVIGFHGTPNEGSVGRAASHGCIRMLNRDVRALYAIAQVGMPVVVEP